MKEYQLKFEEINTKHIQRIKDIKKHRLPIFLLTDGVNDTGNLAMIFRLADALRIKKIFLYNFNPVLNV